jgi:FKBP-type peptidyl-prolyl cis-trans isomerase
MKTGIKLLIFLLGCGVLLSACKKDKSEEELLLLKNYLDENNITTEPTASGMYYIEIKKGSGPDAKGGDLVEVKYKGTFIDGEEFDSGIFSFNLGYGQVIRGWDEGINYMNEGGKAILIIPSNLAYGSSGRSQIPGYSTLIFEVELLNIL